MSDASRKPLVIHGWSVFAHPLFLANLATLSAQVEAQKAKDPVGYTKKNAYKRLVAIKRLAFDIIPQDPTRAEYRQGGTLGDDRKHWFRAKFFQQYRLFFRYHAASKIIVLAWVNDEASKVFKRMLIHGHPPDDWDELLNEAAHRQ
ncbi:MULTISPECIES: type II toxin-antitoxin system YhaV family toxin [unclassified Pseudomonas]|uniref:type II toxin-antitoxin system YhaV family toxin n=1 Tax=unclassified Pseudomonas TaxID=196821 RepID=UPI0021BB4E72|nr:MULTISPECIES: type II toxin-antitoxin system YhaV family toxin [unclassified Pseudomonas]MCT8163853.1 type II toxin-antitoxin system YhaV family toxin [Pseudomonas sp. HD6422]MCT8182796.1 type II toxin-antitoxin system YhaV family toxin [Pseudomonas sp. HD6421]